ncbi:spore coat protein [Paenibacillus sp. TAB 01]|uniref:spore coat protein n=1 Tax=Paenibacillus sp. TAB 01 TaxID=3368988 RepID=UPI003753BEE8
MYQSSYGISQQGTQQSGSIQEQDWGNLVLSELKRTAREYTTAALEATHPAIRQAFQALAQHTMQDQAELFDVLSQLNGYGSVKMANMQEVQQELQQQVHKAEQLQNLVQQAIQSGHAQASQANAFQQSYTANTAFQTGAYQQAQQPMGQQSFGQQQGYGQQQGFGSGAGSQGYGGGSSYSSPASSVLNPSFSANTGGGQSAGSYRTGSAQSGYGGSLTGSSYGSIASKSSTEAFGDAAEPRGGNSYNWSADNSNAARGGNSYNWSASDDTQSSASVDASADKATGHNSKYML